MKFIVRKISDKLIHSAKTRPAIVLSGARQVGKTTLLKHLFPAHNFVSLDLPSTAEAAETDPQMFLKSYGPKVLIDEVQYAPSLFRHIKKAIDEDRNAYGNFILTGSQKFTLMEEVADSLAGRAGIFELEPLSLNEIQNSNIKTPIEEFIFRGGYPELWRNPDLNRNDYYNSYIASYLERDVRQLIRVSSLRDFERFMRVLALRSGQLLNKNEIARDVGVQGSTINDWISVLESSNVVVLLEPWFSNRTKSLTKSPKIYFTDPGLLCALLAIPSAENLLNSPYNGAVWETFVFSELRRNSDGNTKFNYWRDQSGEIDFLHDAGGQISIYEAKWSEQPDKSGFKNIHRFSAKLKGAQVARKSVICRTQDTYEVDGIKIVSAAYLADQM